MADLLGRGYIGGGSIAAIAGISPFSTPLDAWFHIVEPEKYEAEEIEFFENRKALESYACWRFEKNTGRKIVMTNQRYHDPVLPFAKAEIDGETNDGENVEIKTVREAMRDHWGDPSQLESPPGYVEAQEQWGFGVTGRDFGYVMALIGFDDQRVYEVQRDDEDIDTLRRMASNFWQFYVVPRRMPEPTTADDLQRLFPRGTGRKVEAAEDVLKALEQRDRLKRQVRLATAELTPVEFTIKNHMRDAHELTHRGKVVATWKPTANGSRVLRVL
jgi:putative phage-type endonuclease